MQTKILVTGGTGMVGRHLKDLGLQAIYASSKMCDLTDSSQVKEFFEATRPNIVVHLAAKVGGIMDNIKNPVGFFEDNVLINTNVVKYAKQYGCTRFIGILSTCIYPDKLDDSLYPLKEETLHIGPPTQTNFSYGYAKRCLAVQLECYRKQHLSFYSSIIPCNLYSEYDHFEGDKSHFVTSLIRKIYEAKTINAPSIQLFGTGTPLRQFMYAEDLARAIIDYIYKGIYADLNVATDEVYTIKQIAEIALDACDAKHLTINWDISKPDGQYRKDVSDALFKKHLPGFKYTTLKDGIKKTYDNYSHGLAIKRI